MGRGRFITFEGTEGAGKSTLIRQVAAELKRRSMKVTVTREPGGSPVAESIRALILKEAMDPWAELFLYEAARAEHLARTIRPALGQGHWVLCDRYADSSLAYQAHARGLPWKAVRELNQAATQGLQPDVTFLIDIDPRIGLRRAKDRNRFEAEGLAFQQRVRLGFLKARREEPRRWTVLRPGQDTPVELGRRVIADLSARRMV